MADWKQIPDTDVDPDAPVTSELTYALRDNPVAIAEGAAGAPRISPYSLSTGYIGNINTTAQDIVSFIDLNPVSSIVLKGATYGLSSAYLQVSLSTNNGGSWGSWSNISSGNLGSAAVVTESVINTVNGSINTVSSSSSSAPVLSELSVSVPAGKVNAVRFRGSVNNANLIARFLVFVDGGLA